MNRPISMRQQRIRRAAAVVAVLAVISIAVTAWIGGQDPKPTIEEEFRESITDTLKRNLPEGHAKTTFSTATEAFGIDIQHGAKQRASLLPEDMGSGCALDDFDGDGDLDLFVVGFADNVEPGTSTDCVPPTTGGSHRLLRNDGGKYVDVTANAGVGFLDFGIGVAAGDIDGDGLLDLYITCYGKNRLLRNQGNLKFEDVTDAARVGDTGFGAGAAFGDLDRDGDVDLYVCNYVEFAWDGKPPRDSTWGTFSVPYTLNPSSFAAAPNRYYVNDGSGHFEESAERLGIHDPDGRSLACTFADFNGDGWPDLYVLNDVSKNAYFESVGDGKVKDRSLESLAADYRGAMGNAVADIDGDGDLDMFITHWIAQENAVYLNMFAERGGGGSGDSSKPLIFTDQADRMGVGAAALNFVGWGTAFFDYDLDGALDLVVVNGSTMPTREDPTTLTPQRPQLFWHRRGQGFFEVGGVAGEPFEEAWRARGLADGDLDGDGDLDLIVTDNHGPVRVLRNEGPCGNWLTIKPRRPNGNRFAVGARVTVTTPDGSVTQELGAGTSYLCHRPTRLTFGLGSHSTARVEIRWPDGTLTSVDTAKAGQVLEITP